MTKIVFASCMSALNNKSQRVWNDAIAHQPEWLILGGDNIYMDYGLSSGQSKHWSLQKFAEQMERRYKKQFSLPSFRKIVETIPEGQVIGVWDDHDLAWNNCHGADPSHDMAHKKKISTAYFHHYFDELNKRPLASELPSLPIADLKNPPNGTKEIYRALDMPGLRVLLCDGRSWRSEHPDGGAKSDLLGATQEAWLFNELDSHAGPVMLVTGSTMTASSDQAWDYFGEFYRDRFLPAVRDKVILFVGGDIHKNRLAPKNDNEPIEIISSSSGLGRPVRERNFGVIELAGNEASIYLYERGEIEHTGHVNLDTGTYATTMSADLDESAPPLSVDEAIKQKSNAMRALQ